MKRFSGAMMALLGTALLPTAASAVQIPDRGVYVGVYGGVHLSLDDWALGDLEQGAKTVDDGGAVGLRVGAHMAKWVGLEINAGYIPTSTTDDDKIHALDAGFDLYFQATSGRVGVYAMGGSGIYTALAGATGTDVDWQANVGLGVKVMTNDWMDVRIDARHLFTDGLDDNAYNL